MWVTSSVIRAVASGASLKFGVQCASATNWFSRVNGARDNGIWLYRSGSTFTQVMACCQDSTKPLPEPMLKNHQLGPVTITRGQFRKEYVSHELLKLTWKLWLSTAEIPFLYVPCWVHMTATHVWFEFTQKLENYLSKLSFKFPLANELSHTSQWPLLQTWINFNPSMDE